MSTLARIRQLPVPEMAGEPEVDLAKLGELYRRAREHDHEAYVLRREGEDIIRAACSDETFDRSLIVKRLASATKLGRARIYQILNGPTVVTQAVKDSNGNGSNGATAS